MVRNRLETPARGRLLLAADAFLFAGALGIAITSAILRIMGQLAGGPVAVDTLGAVPAAALNLSMTVVPLLGGAALAWWIRGRRMTLTAVGGAAAGVVAGTIVSSAILAAVVLVARQVPSDPNSPPWAMIAVIGALALVVVALPLIDAAQDAKHSRRDHVALDWLRLLSFATIVSLAVIALPTIGAAQGNDLGVAGIYMAPVALAAAFAALGADLLVSWRANHGKDAGAGPLYA